MNKGSINDFYYDLLNINKNNDSLNSIKKVIDNLKEYMKNNDIDSHGMCKVLSNLVHNELTNIGISNQVINTKKLFDCYEHEFILAHYKDDSTIKYILIDLTYLQFLKLPNSKVLYPFKDFPSEYLKQSHVLNDLLENGYSNVDEKDFQNYLFSIHQDLNLINTVTIDDIMYKGSFKR